eukprot:7177527-Karenia_brevis.AAC.1
MGTACDPRGVFSKARFVFEAMGATSSKAKVGVRRPSCKATWFEMDLEGSVMGSTRFQSTASTTDTLVGRADELHKQSATRIYGLEEYSCNRRNLEQTENFLRLQVSGS